MPLVNLKDLELKEPVPGYNVRFVHTDNVTLAYWDIEEGAVLPEHAHVHEQVSNVIEGKFELCIEGNTDVYDSGKVAVIPSNARHHGKALTPVRMICVFYPVREDYK